MAATERGSIKVLLWNVHGLGARLKSEDLEFLCDEKFDIMCLIETFESLQNPVRVESTKQFKKFGVIKKSVNKLHESELPRNPGGFLFAYRKALPYTFSVIPNKSDFILWVRADPHKPESNVQMIFGVIYNPPSDTTTKDEILFIMEREYKFLDKEQKGAKFFIMGDFNAYTCQKIDCSEPCQVPAREFQLENKPSSKSRYEDNGNKLIEFCRNTGFHIANGRFGDESMGFTTDAHVFDYLLCKEKDWNFLEDFKVDSNHGSDHKAVIATLKTNTEFKLTLTCQTKQEPNKDLAIIWSMEQNSDELVKNEITCHTLQQKDVSVKQTILFSSHYRVQAVEQQQRSQRFETQTSTFSVARCSHPLVVENILCFQLQYCLDIKEIPRVVQKTVEEAYYFSFKNYSGATFTFLGTIFTKITNQYKNRYLTKASREVMYNVCSKLNGEKKHGTHELQEPELIIKKTCHRERQIVLWKFALRQVFKLPVTPAFGLDVKLQHNEEGKELLPNPEQLKAIINQQGLRQLHQHNATLMYIKSCLKA